MHQNNIFFKKLFLISAYQNDIKTLKNINFLKNKKNNTNLTLDPTLHVCQTRYVMQNIFLGFKRFFHEERDNN